MTNYINLVGLAYDIAGAYLLGRAIIFNSKEKIAQQVATAWGYNAHHVPAVVEGKIDGIAGLCLLVGGFLFQSSSVFLNGNWWEYVIGLGVLACLLVGYRLALPKMVKWQSDIIIAYLKEKYGE